mgnify:CR=1 FL=1
MLDDELKSLLKRNLELAEENNRMLHSMRRMAIWGGFFKLLWWILILIVPAIIYYIYLAPYVGQITDTYKDVQGLRANLETNNPLSGLKELYEQYKTQGQ